MQIITIPILCGQLPKFLGAVCYEGDKNVSRLEFTGADAEKQYKLDLLHSDGSKNVLDLTNHKGTLVLPLDGSAAIPAGQYRVQLRTVGDTVWHSNMAKLTVKESINAQDAFEQPVPTEMAQLEARITQMVNHPPVPGSDGNWMLWSPGVGRYEKSEHPLPMGDLNAALDAIAALQAQYMGGEGQ